MATRLMVHLSAIMMPPGAIHLSRAYKTMSSMDSYMRKYPIYSEMMISTCTPASRACIPAGITETGQSIIVLMLQRRFAELFTCAPSHCIAMHLCI